MADELRVIDQLYDLILWSHQHVQRFPRVSKYTLGARIEETQLAVLQLLITAKFSKEKTETLFHAGVRLEELRMLFRLCKDMRILNLRSHEFACRQLTELSKQVQGWRRASGGVQEGHET